MDVIDKNIMNGLDASEKIKSLIKANLLEIFLMKVISHFP